MWGLIKNLKIKYSIQVMYTHCDNAGENLDFYFASKHEGIVIEFEYTAPGMLESPKSLTQTLGNGQMIHKKEERCHVEELASSGASTSHNCWWPICSEKQIKITTLISS